MSSRPGGCDASGEASSTRGRALSHSEPLSLSSASSGGGDEERAADGPRVDSSAEGAASGGRVGTSHSLVADTLRVKATRLERLCR